MAIEVQRRRFTVDDYYRMVEAGVLGPDERVELIDGEVVQMSSMGPPHATCVRRLDRLFHQRLGQQAVVSVQLPLRLDRYNEPEPDIALLRPEADLDARHPGPADVLLLVEVADSTVSADVKLKVPRYGQAGVIESWVVSLPAGTVTVFREPTADGYQVVQVLRRGDSIRPLAFPDVAVTVDEVLG